MSITINLVSEEKNTINDFLTTFFEKDMLTDSNTTEWSYVLQEPLTATNIISAVMDNGLEEKITVWVSFDPNVFIKVRDDNYDDIIKYIFDRFSKVS